MKGKFVHKTASIMKVIALISVIGLIFLSPTSNTLAQAPGDANDDGNINILDVTATLNDILAIAPAPGDADCNEDGNVNILDVTCILNIILGPTPTPTPTPTAPPLDGASLYMANCQGCHGPNGEGGEGGFPPNIQGESAEDIQDAIMNVAAMMSVPALQALTSQEIEAIAEFLGQF